MQPRISIATLLLALLGPSPASGQGSDACAMAQGISGTGTFAFDNTSATLDGVPAHDLDVTMPTTQATQITAGSTWNFAAWFRDPAAGGAFFNLSDGLEVTFLP